MTESGWVIRNAVPADLARCYEIEQSAYAGDEAASRENIAKRIDVWPTGFIVLERAGRVAGFINAGAAFDVELSDQEFKALVGHDPAGPNVVIMSVAVHPDFQRQGLARALMVEFIARMRALGKHRIWLICQAGLIDMYASFGYEYLGPSASDYGGHSWHEMALTL